MISISVKQHEPTPADRREQRRARAVQGGIGRPDATPAARICSAASTPCSTKSGVPATTSSTWAWAIRPSRRTTWSSKSWSRPPAIPRNHGYSQSIGITNLRREVASKYFRKYGVRLDPEREMVVCLGSKEGFSHMCLALMGPGDTAIVPAPYFPVHVYAVALASGNVITLEVADSEKFLSNIAYTCEHLHPKPKLLIINYPHNPSTVTVEPEFFVEVVKLARRYGFMVISDLAYADVAFDGYQPPSFLAAPGAVEVGVEFTTMSKGYNMAGWRVGFCAGNAEMVQGPGDDQGLLRLRHVPGDPDRGDHGVASYRGGRRSPGGHLSTSPRRAVSKACGESAGTLRRRVPACSSGPRSPTSGRQRMDTLDFAMKLLEEGRRGGQPRHGLWPGRRRLLAHGAGRERKPTAAGGAADRPLPESSDAAKSACAPPAPVSGCQARHGLDRQNRRFVASDGKSIAPASRALATYSSRSRSGR